MTVHVNQIDIGTEVVQISYVEERDAQPEHGIIEVRTLVVPTAHVDAELDELLDAARALIDQAQLVRRQPAESFTGRR